MDKSALEKNITGFVLENKGNCVLAEIALRPDLAGLKIFDEPLFAYAEAEDPFFDELKKPGIIGPHFMSPGEWLPGARSVISVFLPFTREVREANRKTMDWPADEWLHARIEGQAFQNEICRHMVLILEREGFSALAPMTDPRFSKISPITKDTESQGFYTSNWSERHVAYAAGLGTFGLSRGLITAKGIAGRYISVISSAAFEKSGRPYTGVYDYCIRCGACAKNCPAQAIFPGTGKNHFLCSEFVDSTQVKHKPRYGCGKCQVKVPCEFRNPGARKNCG